jgi:hypothetical protein
MVLRWSHFHVTIPPTVVASGIESQEILESNGKYDIWTSSSSTINNNGYMALAQSQLIPRTMYATKNESNHIDIIIVTCV